MTILLVGLREVILKWVEDMAYGVNASRGILHLLMDKCGHLPPHLLPMFSLS